MESLEPNKYSLAIHTTSPELGLALSNFADDSRCQTWNLGRDLSTLMHQHLTDFIQPQTWRDLAFIAVAKGPGSFTGTRIGVVTARTLAQQLDIPLFAISTLAAVAWELAQNLEINPNGAYALQMPAQRGQIFTAIYQFQIPSRLTQVMPDTVTTPDAWKQTLETLEIPYQPIDIPVGALLGASVSSLLKLAYLDWQQGKRPHWAEALPFYGQHPVADKINSSSVAGEVRSPEPELN